MHPLAMKRARAYARDCVGYAAIALCEVPVGIVLGRVQEAPSPLLLAALSSVPPVGATLWAAWAEARPAHATWGKRAERLTVAGPSGGPGTGRALLRNVVKIALPWTLGHVVAFRAAGGAFERNDPVAWAATALLVPLAGSVAVLAATGAGRPPHDLLAGTRVTRV